MLQMSHFTCLLGPPPGFFPSLCPNWNQPRRLWVRDAQAQDFCQIWNKRTCPSPKCWVPILIANEAKHRHNGVFSSFNCALFKSKPLWSNSGGLFHNLRFRFSSAMREFQLVGRRPSLDSRSLLYTLHSGSSAAWLMFVKTIRVSQWTSIFICLKTGKWISCSLLRNSPKHSLVFMEQTESVFRSALMLCHAQIWIPPLSLALLMQILK